MTTTAVPLSDQVAIYPFDHDHGVAAKDLKDLLGGKGSGLAEMTRALKIPVPPGFTIPLTVSRRYRAAGWPAELGPLLDEQMTALGERMGRRFGDPRDPLLVAVRSGAPVSMPGMLDTILNLGLNDETVAGLAAVSGDEDFAWDSYRRFSQMFATTVLGLATDTMPPIDESASASASKEAVERIRELALASGREIPQDPAEQLRQAVCAVFESWESGRARAYRAKEGIDESMGTAVNVQAMVFGNRGVASGTGVVFTRNPSTGENHPYGDYLPRAQGEDVVAGTAHTLPIASLRELAPQAYDQLLMVLRRLEVHYRDMCDVEFTIEEDTLWLLQTRTGKRSAVAAVRIAFDLVNDSGVRLAKAEAATRVPAELRARARAEILAHESRGASEEGLLGVGLPASPGRVSGRIVLDSDAAVDADEDVILVRAQTSPEDVAGMASSVGILTTSGGLVSHAAVVARGWGIPAVVGAREFTVDGETVRVKGTELHAGDLITIDGSSGQVWLGRVAAGADHDDEDGILLSALPELLALQTWADQTEGGS